MDIQTVIQKKPADYLKMFFRRKWLLIMPALIGLAGGIVAGNILPKTYESSTLILVEEGRVINPLIQGIAVSTSMAQRLGVLREQILGWDRMLQLIKSLDLAKNIKTQLEFEVLVKRLRRYINVTLRGQNLIVISYQGKDPAQAQNIVKTITDIFISENLRQQNKETENAVSFINDQVVLYQKKLKQSEISKMEDDLNKLLVDSTEKHPLVIELKKRIEAAKDELNQGKYDINASTVASGSDSELKAMREDLKKMREELATSSLDASDAGVNRTKMASNTNEKLYKLLLLERIDKVGVQDTSVNQKLYNELLSRLETAKITQRLESSKEGTKYTILDPARLPLKPIKPNKVLVLLIGFFLGVCSGAGLIFIVELFDLSFIGIDEAKSFLELPIFGAISKIVTEADLKTQKLRNTRITGISIATGVVLLIVIIFNVLLGS